MPGSGDALVVVAPPPPARMVQSVPRSQVSLGLKPSAPDPFANNESVDRTKLFLSQILHH